MKITKLYHVSDLGPVPQDPVDCTSTLQSIIDKASSEAGQPPKKGDHLYVHGIGTMYYDDMNALADDGGSVLIVPDAGEKP